MKIKIKLLGLSVFLSVLFFSAKANDIDPIKKYAIKGIIIDQASKNGLEYATVKLLNLPDSTLVTGTISNESGFFELNPENNGNYLIEIYFIGYDKHIQELSVTNENSKIDLGEIKIHPSSSEIEEVIVKGNKNSMDYQIDKKVLHVSSQFTSLSGTAVDLLQNAASVQVDIEGNVSLRGNSNFTVLIDGRPTVLDANDALESIPASMIQDIEIITNPSAKYDPEGTAGIINIITKKRSLTGFSGLANLNLGLDEKYGGDLLLNYRAEHINVFVGGDYNKNKYPGNMEFEQRTTQNGIDNFLNSEGERSRSRGGYSLRTGIELFFSDKTNLNLSGRFGNQEHNSASLTNYSEWTSLDTQPLEYYSVENGDRGGNYYSFESTFTHKFKPRDHQFDASFQFSNREGNELNVNTLQDADGVIQNSQKSTENGPGASIEYRLNYQQKFNDFVGIETGWEGRIGNSQETNGIYYYNTLSGEYNFQDEFSHDVNYETNIQAAYALVKGAKSNLGYQFGFRTEYTYRTIGLEDTGESFDIDRFDYFPGLHLSYKLTDKDQLMGSYTKRINRPRGWDLEPFYTWDDAYNVRKGNPNLQPEYIDAYEIAYQKLLGDNTFTVEAYYRTTENKIERIRQVYDENVILRTVENVGTDYSLGTEFVFNTKLTKFWDVDMTANFYDYRVKGQLLEQNFDQHSFTWGVRMNNTFVIKPNITLQMNPSYSGPQLEAQEIEEGSFRVDAALKMSFLEKKLQATLQVRDVFGTAKHESTLDTPLYYTHLIYTHKSPMLMLNLSWRIKNYKTSKPERTNGGEGGGEDDM